MVGTPSSHPSSLSAFLRSLSVFLVCGLSQVAQQLQNARLGPGPGNQAQGAVVSSLGGGDVGPAGRASEEAMKLQAGTE